VSADAGRRQLAAGDLATMSADDIAQAYSAGRCRELMTGRPVPEIPAEGQLAAHHLAHMTSAEIDQAYRAGRLRDLMTRGPDR